MRGKTGPSALWVLALITVWLAGCSTTPTIVTNSDPSVDWSQYRTFGFFSPLGTDRSTVRSIISNQLEESSDLDCRASEHA